MIGFLALPAALLITSAPASLGDRPAISTQPSSEQSVAGDGVDWSKTFRGVSRPIEVRDLAFPVRGRVVEVLVEPGDRVTPGQPLMRMEDDLERASLELARIRAEDQSEVLAAESRYAYRAENFQLTLESNAAGGASVSDLRESKFLYEQAGFDLEIARRTHAEAVITLAREQARLDQLTIRSPLHSLVVEVLKQPGEGVDELTTIVTLVDTDTLMVEVGVPPLMAMQVNEGMGARITWDDLPNAPEIQGTVAYRAPAGHAGVRSVPVRIRVPNPANLPSGLHANVTLLGPERNAAGERASKPVEQASASPAGR